MPIQKVKKELPRDVLHGNATPHYNNQLPPGSTNLNALRNQLNNQAPNTNCKPPVPALDENALDITSLKGIFGWTTVDGVSLPYLFREAKYVAVRMVELKLLFKYPNAYPEELKKRPPLMSHYVTEAEAKLLNEINIEHCESEFGRHQFTVKDLVVRLEEFKDFYKIVKEAFPDTDARENKDEGEIQGGWLQINNTVVPYILRNPVGKLVPFSMVQYAAELLNGVQIDGTTLPTEKECTYFNDNCKKAGLNFFFGRTTKLIKLTQVTQLCKLDVLEVTELPKDNPFKVARFKNIPYPTRNGYPNQKGPPGNYMGNSRQGRPGQPNMGGPHGPPPPYYPPGMMPSMQRPMAGTTTGQRGSSGATSTRYPTQRNPNTQSTQGVGNPPQRSANPSNDPRGPPNVMISQSGWPPRVPQQQAQGTVFVPPQFTQGSFHQMQIMNGQMVPVAGTRPGGQSGTHSAKPGPTQSQPQNPPPKKLIETLSRNNNRPRAPLEETRVAQSRPSAIQKQPPTSMSYHVSSMLQNSITPIEFHKKTVSCLSTNNDKWALMEAIGKLYFPYCTMEEFQEALETVLRCPVRGLTPEEERAFIEFYGLPTSSLNCNKVVKLDDLEKYMTQLKYMFQDKEEKMNHTSDTNSNKRKSSEGIQREMVAKKRKPNMEGDPGATTIVMNGDDVILIE